MGASAFVGDIPAHYDAGLGPNIFEPYAEDMARRAGATGASDVLEIAAGTGIVSRRLRDALPAAKLTVTDLNAPMLAIARGKFAGGEGVTFSEADAMALPFADGAFDLIVCQFGLMFFPDKVGALREARRVLKPGGRYLFNVWGPRADNAFARISHGVASEAFANDPPAFYDVPFSLADPARVLADANAAGFATVEHEAAPVTRKVRNLPAFARALVFGNPLIEEIRARGGDAEALVAEIARRMRAEWGEAEEMRLVAHVYDARK